MPSSRIKSLKATVKTKNNSQTDRAAFEQYMTNLFTELKSGRQQPRNSFEKEKLTEWSEGDLIATNLFIKQNQSVTVNVVN